MRINCVILSFALVLASVICVPVSVVAQLPDTAQKQFSYGLSLTGPKSNLARSVAIDQKGNILTLGLHKAGSTKIQFADRIDTILPSTSFNYETPFVTKYSPQGDLLWVREITYNEDIFLAGLSVETDSKNSVYITGGGPVSRFGNTADHIELRDNNGTIVGGAYMLKLDSAGQRKFGFAASGVSALNTDLFVTSVAPDKEGNVNIAGRWTILRGPGAPPGSGAPLPFKLYKFDGQTGLSTELFDFLSLPGNWQHSIYESYITQLSADGQQLNWIITCRGTFEYDVITNITTDKQNNIIAAGYFNTNDLLIESLNGGGIQGPFAAVGDSDIIVVKINPAGEILWAKQFGGAGKDLAHRVTTDESGHVYITGQFEGQISFGSTILTSAGGNGDIFVAKLDGETGAVLWAASSGGRGKDYATGIGVSDSDSTLYVSGNFNGANYPWYPPVDGKADFAGVPTLSLSTIPLTSAGGQDVFIAQYSLNGALKNVLQVKGGLDDYAEDMTVSNEALAVAGGFYSPAFTVQQKNPIHFIHDPDQSTTDQDGWILYKSADTSLIVHVKEASQNLAAYVELWTRDKKTKIKKIEELAPGDRAAIFTSGDLKDMNVYDCYLLRADSSIIGKINLLYKEKNRRAGRKKEVILFLHNDLQPYQLRANPGFHPEWKFANWYKYDFKKPDQASESESAVHISPGVTYPVSMLVPPVNDSGSYKISTIRSSNRPVVFVHGYTDIDGVWGTYDAHTIQPAEIGNEVQIDIAGNYLRNGEYLSDYAFTSAPSRLRRLSNKTFDCWEFYYPPDAYFDESAFLFGRAVQYLAPQYSTGKVSVVPYSMGGLVTGHYTSETAVGYGPNGTRLGIPFNNDIDRVLILASPQHGSFLSNRTYGEIFLSEGNSQDAADKDPFAPGLLGAGVAKESVENMMRARLTTNPVGPGGDGVEYFMVAGSFNPLFRPWFLLPGILESKFHEDQIVSIHSTSLLEYGIDLGILEGFHHGSFAKTAHIVRDTEIPKEKFIKRTFYSDPELPPYRRNIVPLLAFDFLSDGQLSVASRNLFLAYLNANDPTPPNPLPPVNTNEFHPVRMDIVNPYLSFRINNAVTGPYWKPRLDPSGGFRFRFFTKLNSGGNRVGVLTREKFLHSFAYLDQGLYLYYADDNFSEDALKRTRPRTSNLFHAYERSFINKQNQPPRYNPLDFSLNPANIASTGTGWHMPHDAFRELDLDIAYKLLRYDLWGNPTTKTDKRYARLTAFGNPKLRLAWARTTLNEFIIPQEFAHSLDADMILRKEIINFTVPAGESPTLPPPNEDLTAWIDDDVEIFITMFHYEDAPELAVSLLDPNNNPANPDNLTIFFTHDSELKVKYYTVLNPQPGQWKLMVNGQNQLPPGDSRYSVDYNLRAGNNLITAIDTSRYINDSSVVVTASLTDNAMPASNQQVYGHYNNEDDETGVTFGNIEFTDDGIGPDLVAGDKIYTATFVRHDTISYDIVATMAGKLGTGQHNFVRQSKTSLPPCTAGSIDFLSVNNCAGRDAEFYAAVEEEDLIRTYQWIWGDGDTTYGADQIHRYAIAGTYHVQLRLFTYTGCVIKFEKQIVINSSPVASPLISSVNPPQICSNDSLYLQAGNGFDKYAWFSFPGEDTLSKNNPFVVKTSGEYYAVVSNSYGCSDNSDTIAVEIKLAPVVRIQPDRNPVFCAGGNQSPITLNASGTGIVEYLWNDPVGTATSQLIVTTPGTYKVTVVGMNGCEASDSIVIVQRPELTPQIASTNKKLQVIDFGLLGTYYRYISCQFGRPEEEPIHFDGGTDPDGNEFASYTWKLFNIQTGAEQTVGNQKQFTVTGIAPNYQYYYTLTVADQYGCTGSDTKVVIGLNSNFLYSGLSEPGVPTSEKLLSHNIGPIIAGYITPTYTVNDCPNSFFITSAYTDYIGAKAGDDNYINWYRKNGGANILVSEDRLQLRPTQSGNYYAEISYLGCHDSSFAFPVVLKATEQTQLSHTGSLNTCSGQSLILDAGASSSGSNFSSYRWFRISWRESDTTDIFEVPERLLMDTFRTISITKSGFYYCRITSPQTGCFTLSDTLKANVAVAEIAGQATIIRCGSPYILRVVEYSQSPFDEIQWYKVGSPDILVGTGREYTVTQGNSGQYYCRVKKYGCWSLPSMIHTVTIHPQGGSTTPVITVTGPTSFCHALDSVKLDAGGGYYTYKWYKQNGSNPDGFVNDAQSIVLKYMEQTDSYYVITTINGEIGPCGSVSGTSAPVAITIRQAPNRSVTVENGTNITPVASGGIYGSCAVAVRLRHSQSFNAEWSYTWTRPNGSIFSGYQLQNLTPDSNGTYRLVVSNNAPGNSLCMADISITLALQKYPIIADLVMTDPVCPNGNCGGQRFCSATIAIPGANGADARKYVWKGKYINTNGDDNYYTIETTTPFVTVRKPGIYSVNVYGTGGCLAEYQDLNLVPLELSATLIIDNNPVLQAGFLDPALQQPIEYNANEPEVIDPETQERRRLEFNTCEGIILTLTPNYYDPSYQSYTWSNGIQNDSADIDNSGEFYLTVTNEGCTGNSAVFKVIQLTPTELRPRITIENENLPRCLRDSMILDAGAGDGVNTWDAYLWNTGETTRKITVKRNGVYWVTVMDGLHGCSATSPSVNIELNDPEMIGLTIASSDTCIGKRFEFKAVNPYTGEPIDYGNYLWIYNNGSYSKSFTGPGTHSDTFRCTGPASIRLIDFEGCMVKKEVFIYPYCAGSMPVSSLLDDDCGRVISLLTDTISWNAIYPPTCAVPGPTTQNQREVNDECMGPPLTVDIFCADVYDPVCGCNGITYPNSCLAEWSGVKRYTAGICSPGSQVNTEYFVRLTTNDPQYELQYGPFNVPYMHFDQPNQSVLLQGAYRVSVRSRFTFPGRDTALLGDWGPACEMAYIRKTSLNCSPNSCYRISNSISCLSSPATNKYRFRITGIDVVYSGEVISDDNSVLFQEFINLPVNHRFRLTVEMGIAKLSGQDYWWGPASEPCEVSVIGALPAGPSLMQGECRKSINAIAVSAIKYYYDGQIQCSPVSSNSLCPGDIVSYQFRFRYEDNPSIEHVFTSNTNILDLRNDTIGNVYQLIGVNIVDVRAIINMNSENPLPTNWGQACNIAFVPRIKVQQAFVTSETCNWYQQNCPIGQASFQVTVNQVAEGDQYFNCGQVIQNVDCWLMTANDVALTSYGGIRGYEYRIKDQSGNLLATHFYDLQRPGVCPYVTLPVLCELINQLGSPIIKYNQTYQFETRNVYDDNSGLLYFGFYGLPACQFTFEAGISNVLNCGQISTTVNFSQVEGAVNYRYKISSAGLPDITGWHDATGSGAGELILTNLGLQNGRTYQVSFAPFMNNSQQMDYGPSCSFVYNLPQAVWVHTCPLSTENADTRLRWRKVAGAYKYEIRLTRISNTLQSQTIINTTVNAPDTSLLVASIADLLPGETYEAAVRPVFANDIKGRYSAGCRFNALAGQYARHSGSLRMDTAGIPAIRNYPSFIEEMENELKVYPNPLDRDLLTISLVVKNSKDPVRIEISDMYGRLVQRTGIAKFGRERYQLNMKGIANGSYFVTAIIGNRRINKPLLIMR